MSYCTVLALQRFKQTRTEKRDAKEFLFSCHPLKRRDNDATAKPSDNVIGLHEAVCLAMGRTICRRTADWLKKCEQPWFGGKKGRESTPINSGKENSG